MVEKALSLPGKPRQRHKYSSDTENEPIFRKPPDSLETIPYNSDQNGAQRQLILRHQKMLRFNLFCSSYSLLNTSYTPYSYNFYTMNMQRLFQMTPN